jgi:hypothetical protein
MEERMGCATAHYEIEKKKQEGDIHSKYFQ